MATAVAQQRPPGSGWEAIPGGHHGGFRRRRGKDYEYWYHGKAAPRLEVVHRAASHNLADYERAGAAWEGVRPNAPLEVAGAAGVWHYVPGHPGETGSVVRVQRPSDGEARMVKKDRVFALKLRTRKQRLPPEKPHVVPLDVSLPPKKDPVVRRPSVLGRPMPAIKGGSREKPGTIVHALETGGYPYKEVWRRYGESPGQHRALAPHLPEEDRAKLFSEFAPLIRVSARRAMRSLRVAEQGTVREDVEAGGRLGLMEALSAYRGDRPFTMLAVPYIRAYAGFAARREMVGGLHVQDRHARQFARYTAARAQAQAKAGGKEPSQEQVLKQWRARKGDLYRKLPEGELMQPLPDDSWTDGRGKRRRGKSQWAEVFDYLAGVQTATRGGQALAALGEDDDEPEIPDAQQPTAEEHLSREQSRSIRRKTLDKLVSRLPEPHATVLRMKFGLHRPDGEGASDTEVARAFDVPSKKRRGNIALASKLMLVPRIIEEAKAKLAELAQRDAAARQAILDEAEDRRAEVLYSGNTADPDVEYGPERPVTVLDPTTGEEAVHYVRAMRGTPYREREYPHPEISSMLRDETPEQRDRKARAAQALDAYIARQRGAAQKSERCAWRALLADASRQFRFVC